MPGSIALYIENADTRITRVTIRGQRLQCLWNLAESLLGARRARCSDHGDGGSTTYGLGIDPVNQQNMSATFNDAKIVVQDASSTSYEIQFGSGGQPNIEQSQIRASAPTSYGIYSPAAFTSILVDHSAIAGVTDTIVAYDRSIGATRLHGGPVNAATATCAGVYDESFIFYASTCP